MSGAKCPVCKRGDGAWLNCMYPGCTDGRNLVQPIENGSIPADQIEKRGTISDRDNWFYNRITELENQLANALEMKNIAYAAGYYQAHCGLDEHENAEDAVAEYYRMVEYYRAHNPHLFRKKN
jgi:hypothetical protein